MSVAKSYEKYEIIGEPYEHDKRQYVKIKYPCCRKSACAKCYGEGYYLKEVRWHDDPIVFDARKGFGFHEAGYITLLKGPQDTLEHFFKEIAPRQARYNLLFLWYLPSILPVPENLPKEVELVRLNWEEVSTNGIINNYDDIKEYVGSLLSTNIISEYVGKVGDRIESDFVVIKATENKNYYGGTTTYIFEDENSNQYSWTTAARKLEVGEIYHLKGTIKEHIKMEGIKQTILTRCMEG